MSAESPWALPVRVDEELPPVNLAPPGDGTVVALVADEGPRSQGWAARVAVSLAREWAGDGLKVFLADGDLDRPALHLVLNQGNEEGVADAVVYGASPGRIGRPVPDGGFVFAPAGTVVPDADQAWAHPRWDTLLGAFRESGSLLLLYLPAGEGAGLGGLVGRADRVIRFVASAPGADPGRGHLYIHPEPGSEGGMAGSMAPDAEARTSGFELSDEAPLDPPVPGFAVADDGPTGEDAPSPDFPLPDAGPTAEEASTGDLVFPEEGPSRPEPPVGDFALPAEDPGVEEETPVSGSGRPEEDPVKGGDELADSDFVLDDAFPTGDVPSAPEEEVWTGTGELQITDEWAGEGPSSLTDDPPEPEEEARSAPEPPAQAWTPVEPPATRPSPGAPEGIEGSLPPPPVARPAPLERALPEPRQPPVPRPDPAPRPPVQARPAERTVSPVLLVVLAIILAALLVAHWFGYVAIPGLGFALPSADLAISLPAPPTPIPAG